MILLLQRAKQLFANNENFCDKIDSILNCSISQETFLCLKSKFQEDLKTSNRDNCLSKLFVISTLHENIEAEKREEKIEEEEEQTESEEEDEKNENEKLTKNETNEIEEKDEKSGKLEKNEDSEEEIELENKSKKRRINDETKGSFKKTKK